MRKTYSCGYRNTRRWRRSIWCSNSRRNWSVLQSFCVDDNNLTVVYLMYPYAYFYANSGISHKNCKLSCKICIKIHKFHNYIDCKNLIHLVVSQTQAEKDQLPVKPGTLPKLQSHIETIILSLPEDLQGILHKPPSP